MAVWTWEFIFFIFKPFYLSHTFDTEILLIHLTHKYIRHKNILTQKDFRD